ncbi:MAG: pyrroline-5-carboxylate reductase [Eubacterium sp.]|nr:pyrroline-5-carboxylate reductase [Eubacterium sp.]
MSEKITKRIGFIGCGNMGGAILKGIVQSGIAQKEQIYVYDISEEAQEAMRAYGVRVMVNNEQVCKAADIIFLAVKPQYMKETLATTKRALDDKCVISIAAGLSAERIRAMIDGKPRVLRTMPNTPAMVLSGAFALCSDCDLTEDEKKEAELLFQPLGIVEWVPEALIDAVCGVSGSGPAYVAMFIEAMADGGVREGLPRATAYKLAAQTVMGTAQMYLESGMHPGAMKDMVTSPAGTTIEGCYALEKGGMRAAVMDAVHVGAEKSRELGKK